MYINYFSRRKENFKVLLLALTLDPFILKTHMTRQEHLFLMWKMAHLYHFFHRGL